MINKIMHGFSRLFFCSCLILAVYGCASTMDPVNKGAEKTGEGVGRVMRVPHSASEGAAKGIAGQPESNPYGR